VGEGHLRDQDEVDAGRDGQRRLARGQRRSRQVRSDERRGACGVHADAGPWRPPHCHTKVPAREHTPMNCLHFPGTQELLSCRVFAFVVSFLISRSQLQAV